MRQKFQRSSRLIIILAMTLGTSLRVLAQEPAAGDFTVAVAGIFSDHSSDSPASTPQTVALPLAATMSLNPNFTLHISANSIVSVKVPGEKASTGFGDSKLGISGTTPQVGIVQFAGDYTVKLPTADSAKGLGSGFTDHQLTFSPAAAFGSNGVSADFGIDVVGTSQSHDPYYFVNGYFTRSSPAQDRELDLEIDYTPSAHGNPSDAVFIVSSKIRALSTASSTRSRTWTVTPGLTAGLVSSSSRWGAFLNVTYSNSKTQPAAHVAALVATRPAVGRHILGLGLSGSRR